MNVVRIALLLGALSTIAPVSTTPPDYPPAATRGGTVVAELDLQEGVPRLARILSGEEPFLGAVQSALMRWKFTTSSERDRVIVVVCFCAPGLFGLGTRAQEVRPIKEEPRLPFPTAVVEPALPPNSLGEGSVVLGLQLGADGAISDIRVVRGAGNLGEASIEAVRRWKFRPAEDDRGIGEPSEAFAVLVFRPPVLAPGPVRR